MDTLNNLPTDSDYLLPHSGIPCKLPSNLDLFQPARERSYKFFQNKCTYYLLVGRPTIGLPTGFSIKLSHVQWGIPQTRNGGATFFPLC